MSAVQDIAIPRPGPAVRPQAPVGAMMVWHRVKKALSSPTPYLTLLGIFIWLFFYWLFCEALSLPRFEKIPGPVTVLTDWLSREPQQGMSIFVSEYYVHILVSCRRILI